MASGRIEKPGSLLPHWMRQSLEHFNATANMEDFGASPPENESVFLHEPFHHYSVAEVERKHNNSEPRKPLLIQAKEIRPRHTQHYNYNDQQLCPTVGHPESGSAQTTPSVTPQHSPHLVKKMMAADIKIAGARSKSVTDGARSRTSHITLKPVVTNFDLNAVSPTSW